MGGVLRAKVVGRPERRILVRAMRQVDIDRTRDLSQRQLPTDDDCAGGQSCSIREYQSDQPSCGMPLRPLLGMPHPYRGKSIKKKRENKLDGSLHISSALRAKNVVAFKGVPQRTPRVRASPCSAFGAPRLVLPFSRRR